MATVTIGYNCIINSCVSNVIAAVSGNTLSLHVDNGWNDEDEGGIHFAYKEAINSIEIMTREHSSFLHPERERGFEQSYCETTLTEQDLYVVALASFMICEFGRKNDEFSDTLIRDIIAEVTENEDIALKVYDIVEFDF